MMKLEPNVWFDEVVKTYHLISPHIHHTQLVTCPDLNEELDGMYLFKPESLQITGSFKVRGALSAISRLSKKELKRGVIAYSSGNHAQGVAHAAKVFNTPATVVIDAPIEFNTPEGLWRPKNASSKFYGPTPLRTGIEKSRNLMTIRVAQDVGMKTIADYAERFGVYMNMRPYLANSLGPKKLHFIRWLLRMPCLQMVASE